MYAPHTGFLVTELNAPFGRLPMLFMMPSSFGAGTSPTWESTIGLAVSIAFVGSAMADGATIPATSSAAVTANFRIALPSSPCRSRWLATAG